MHWVYLGVAILLELAGTTTMKLSQGFNNLWPSVLMFIFYVSSLSIMNLALKRIDVSIAYAIWSGVGTALIALIGMALFKEALTPLKGLSILLIIAGVVGLNLGGGH